MSNETRTCIDCGREFTWSYGEQRYFRERSLQPPKHCKECLGWRKRQLDPGMRSEVGQPYDFVPPTESTAPPRDVSPESPTQVPPPRRPASPPQPLSWWRQPGNLSTVTVLWLAMVLITFRVIGWPLALIEVVLGIALYIWLSGG